MIYSSRLAPVGDTGNTHASFIHEAEPSALNSDSRLKSMVHSGKLYFQDGNEQLPSLGNDQAEVKILAIGISPAVGPMITLPVW